MKLIKKGGIKNIFTGTCKGCRSQFEAEAGELNVISSRDGSLAKAKCTECPAEFWLYPKTTSLQPTEC